MTITKKQRIRLRSIKYNDMHPHIFDKAIKLNPYMLAGVRIPYHYGEYK